MKSVRPRLAGIGLALVGVMALAACSSSGGSGSNSSAPPAASGGSSSAAAGSAPSSVTIAEIAPNAAFAPSYAARGTGAFAAVEKQFNTKIKFEQLGTAIATTNAMLGGSAQVSLGALSTYVLLASGGKSITAAFTPFIGGGGVFIGAKKYEKTRGTDLAKFKGGTFGYTREGSASQLLLKLATEKAGISWNSVKHVAFGQPSAGGPLLRAGRLDIAAVDPTTAAQAIDAGQAYLILNLADAKVAEPIVGEQLSTVYAFQTSFTTKYPALTKALVGALAKGLDAVKKAAADPAAVLKLFPSDIQSQLKDGFASAWKLTEPGILASDGSLPAKAVSDSMAFAVQGGLLKQAQAAYASKVVNNSFLP